MTWRAYPLPDGFWWSGIEIRGAWTPIYRVGPVGGRVRF